MRYWPREGWSQVDEDEDEDDGERDADGSGNEGAEDEGFGVVVDDDDEHAEGDDASDMGGGLPQKPLLLADVALVAAVTTSRVVEAAWQR